MDQTQLLALFDEDQRKNIVYPFHRREALPNIVRLVHTVSNKGGVVVYSRLDETDVDAAIREQVAWFEGIGQNFEWPVYGHDSPPDLVERLVAAGFEADESESVMVLDVARAPKTLQQPVPPSVRRITNVAHIEHVRQVELAVWGREFDDLVLNLSNIFTHYPEQISIYVAYVDEEPAACSWVFFPKNNRFGGLWGGSTRSEFRQRGLYTAMLAARVQEAQQRQVQYLRVDASDMSRPILAKFGFEVIAQATPCNWMVKSNAAA